MLISILFYIRMVATLNPCMPDIAVQLGQYLKQEFRWQLRKKDQMKIESKLKVCRFIGELVKFQHCSDCGQAFHGAVKLALGWACWKEHQSRVSR